MRRLLGAAVVSLVISTLASITAAAQSQASITLSPTSGQTGTAVTITGAGFPAGEIVALYIDSAGPYLAQPGPRADATGAFHLSFTMPDKSYDPSGRVDPTRAGTHTICGDTSYPGSAQAVSARACAQFVVVAGPKTTPSPSPFAPQGTTPAGPTPVAVAVVLVILLAIAGAAFVLLRRSG